MIELETELMTYGGLPGSTGCPTFRQDMPKGSEIRAYWAATRLWEEKGLDGPRDLLDKEMCFACTRVGIPIQRCHIIPVCKGGSNHVANLHMLCRVCHEDSEHLVTVASYWPWLIERTMVDATTSTFRTHGVNFHSALERYRPGLGYEIFVALGQESIRLMGMAPLDPPDPGRSGP
jgi:hypothetical protein